MVDDTISISKCGIQSVKKNDNINYFIENQKLTLSYEKSAVIHIGNDRKCREKFRQFKVHDPVIKQVKSFKYLGDKVTDTGNVIAITSAPLSFIYSSWKFLNLDTYL